VVSGSNPPGHREVQEVEARPRPGYAPPGKLAEYLKTGRE